MAIITFQMDAFGTNIKLQTIVPSYYIVISRVNQVMLSFLNIRVIVNSKEIYPLLNDELVVIPVNDDHPKIVVTDGFHFTKPLELAYHEPSYYHCKIVCVINDLQLFGGFFLLIFFYLFGFLTGFFWLKLASFAPIIYFLFLYYINRKEFIQIVPA
jgi:hypothetical protein